MSQVRYWSAFAAVAAILVSAAEFAISLIGAAAGQRPVVAAGLTVALYALAVVLDFAPPGRPGREPEAGQLPLRGRSPVLVSRPRPTGARATRTSRCVLLGLALVGFAPLGLVATLGGGSPEGQSAKASTPAAVADPGTLEGRWLLTDVLGDGSRYSFVVDLQEVAGQFAGGGEGLAMSGARNGHSATASFRQGETPAGAFSWERQSDGRWTGIFRGADGTTGQSVLSPYLGGRWQLVDTLAGTDAASFTFTITLSDNDGTVSGGGPDLAISGRREGSQLTAKFSQGGIPVGTFQWSRQDDGSWLGTFSAAGGSATGTSRLTAMR